MKKKLAVVWLLILTLVCTLALAACGEPAVQSIFVRYSSSADGEDFTEEWSEGQDYLGIAVGAEAPDEPNGYTWVKFKGEKGDKGDKGDQGENGQNGANGQDGVDGVDGEDGQNGTSSYTHIRYALDANGNGMTAQWQEDAGLIYIGFAVTSSANAPVNKNSYTWSRIKGEDAVNGKSIKILAIGNSFSDDATDMLWRIYKNAGYEQVVIGNMYIGGCTVGTHWNNIQNNAYAYTYRKNMTGTWINTSYQPISMAVADEKWDVITLQQASGLSGTDIEVANINNILGYLRNNVTNPNCKYYWHMTWAYQQNSTHGDFAKYNNDQATMYGAITNLVQTNILTNDRFSGVIPSGTAIQNLRTSALGDTVTCDGYHLTRNVGRYTAALTWFAAISGEDVNKITYLPSEGSNNYGEAYGTSFAKPIEDNFAAIKQSVQNAIVTPYSVTNCTVGGGTSGSVSPLEYDTMTAADNDYLTGLGLDPTGYKKLVLDWTVNGFYNSADGNWTSNVNTSAGNSSEYNCTRIFSKEQLPNGTVVRVDSGYRYRPEGWISLTAVNDYAVRPGEVDTATVTVDASWWGSWEYRAFNLSKTDDSAVVAGDCAYFAIYVPV